MEKTLSNPIRRFGSRLLTAFMALFAAVLVVPAQAQFVMPTEATTAFSDAALAAAALGAAAIAVVVAWQLGKMVIRGIRSFLG